VKCSLSGDGAQISIDYRRPDPPTDKADRAYAMYHEGALEVEIAKELNLSKSRVTALLKMAHAARGEEMPDGRSRRSRLANKHQRPRPYQLIAADAVALMNRFPDAKIARKLGCRDFAVARAIQYWREMRNLPIPTTRERRNARAQLAKRLVDDEGMTFGAAKAELECCNVTLGKLLDLAYKLEGRERPDGRSQRKRHGSNQPPRDQTGRPTAAD
jgi:hypothetical protein